MHENEVATVILDACFKIHRSLGPGLLESVYEAALCHELERQGIPFSRQVKIPVEYDGVELGLGFRADLIVDQSVLVELKSVETLTPIFKKKLLNHLKLTKRHLGLLINFNVPLLRDGIVRMANNLKP